MLRDANITLDNISDYREIEDHVASFLFERFKNEWSDVNVNRQDSRSGSGRNKLRKYKQEYKWVSLRQNLSSGFPTMRGSVQSPQLHRLARLLKCRMKQVEIKYFSVSE